MSEKRLVVKVTLGEDTRRVALEKPVKFSDLSALFKELFGTRNFTIKYRDEDGDLVTVTSDLELAEAIRLSEKAQLLRLLLTEPKPSARSAQSDQQSSPFANIPNLNQILENPQVVAILQNLSKQAENVSLPDLNSLISNLGLNDQNAVQVKQCVEQFLKQVSENPMVKDVVGQLSQVFQDLKPSSPQSHQEKSEKENEEKVEHFGVICDSCQSPIFGIRWKCSNCPDYDLCSVCEKKPGVHDVNHLFLKVIKPVNHRSCPYSRSRFPRGRPTPRCGNLLPKDKNYLARFVMDTTIPDGIEIPQGKMFLKIWRMRNEGEDTWPEGTQLVFVGGDKLSHLDSVPVPPVPSGNEIDIAVEMSAPMKPGRYVSYWRLAQSDGNRFGQRLWADIVVLSQNGDNVSEEVSKEVQVEPNQDAKETQVECNQDAKGTQVEPSQDAKSTQAEPSQDVKSTQTETSKVPAESMEIEQLEEPESPYEIQLYEMGFTDKALNKALLKVNDNDLMKTLADLLKFA